MFVDQRAFYRLKTPSFTSHDALETPIPTRWYAVGAGAARPAATFGGFAACFSLTKRQWPAWAGLRNGRTFGAWGKEAQRPEILLRLGDAGYVASHQENIFSNRYWRLARGLKPPTKTP